MPDAILLIHANSAGDPSTPGTVGHFVRVSDNPHMTPVNEFTDGGSFPHADCGPAAILSTLADRGQHPTAKEVEAACGTTGSGTQVAGVSKGLGHFGVVNHWHQGDPAAGYLMNPAGGRLLPPSAFPAYLAASQHWVITIDSPDPWKPDPPAPPTEETDVFLATGGVRPTGVSKDVHGDGAVYLTNGIYKRWISGAAAPALPQYVEAYGPVQDWSQRLFALDTIIELLPSIDGTRPVVNVLTGGAP